MFYNIGFGGSTGGGFEAPVSSSVEEFCEDCGELLEDCSCGEGCCGCCPECCCETCECDEFCEQCPECGCDLDADSPDVCECCGWSE